MKIEEGKPKLSLIYKSFIDETAKVRMYGLTKYPDQENWRTTLTSEHYDALLRHVFAAKAFFLKESRGEKLDQSSGLSHLAHAACNIMFLIEEEQTATTDIETETIEEKVDRQEMIMLNETISGRTEEPK